MSTKRLTKTGLTPKEEKFCSLYISKEFYCNGVESYGEAFGLDLSNPKQNHVARTMASRLLAKVAICSRISEHLDLAGFNDQNIDKQLLLAINQNVDFSSKVKAIDSYNKLKKRIDDKLAAALQINDCTITLKLD